MKLLLVVLLTGCAALSVDVLRVPRGAWAITECVNNAPISVEIGGLSMEDSAAVAVHEAVHRRQMRPNCKAFRERYVSDTLFALAMEGEAYCEGSRTYPPLRRKLAWEGARNFFADRLASDSLSRDLILESFGECP